jgi:hypothetical protein
MSSWRKWLALGGIGCVVAAVVGGGLKLGEVEMPAITSGVRQGILGGLGLLLVIVSLTGATKRSSAHGGTLADCEFWTKVFEAMPPAFVKEYPVDTHLTDNHALRVVQGHKPKAPADTTELHMLINADHRSGDRIAAETGASVQLEYSDQFSTKYPQLILTFKTRVEHNQRTYIVGWYVPIEVPYALPESDTLDLTKRGEQVVFSMPSMAAPGENPFLVSIGKAVRRKLAPVARPRDLAERTD